MHGAGKPHGSEQPLPDEASTVLEIPRATLPDSTVSLMRKPYDFVSEQCDKHGTDLFETRLLLEPTICMRGPHAAELLYDEDKLQRHGAAPIRIQRTLFGEGGVQGMDGEAHRHRKGMFLDLTTPERARALARRFGDLWQATAQRWESTEHVELYDAARELLTRSVLPWAGVPVDESEIPSRTRQLSSLFETAGSVGPSHWRGRMDRWLADRWTANLVGAVRSGNIDPAKDTPLHTIAWHRDLEGQLLEPREAGVELLNVLRPTVAIAVYVTFVAHALHEHPDWDEGIDEAEAPRWFVQEVRRHYPFFPAVTAIVREGFTWKGYRFPEGQRVLLDIDGTNHDLRTWEDPQQFRPERFRHRDETPYGFIPQGGGDPGEGHRCPGEPPTLAIMETALSCLQAMDYKVPNQDLEVDRSRLPALPEGGFVISDVRPSRAPETDIRPPERRTISL